mmetsp:Transcript_31803/g.75573  ORF Transcript_31803/g.75573 Transcript_31803/m.75573 type:complete len:356 (-) Transcript_31803:133-1200(-)
MAAAGQTEEVRQLLYVAARLLLDKGAANDGRTPEDAASLFSRLAVAEMIKAQAEAEVQAQAQAQSTADQLAQAQAQTQGQTGAEAAGQLCRLAPFLPRMKPGVLAHKEDTWRLDFEPAAHVYTIRNVEEVDEAPRACISVTTKLAAMGINKFDADMIIGKNYAMWQSTKTSKYFNMSKEAIKGVWEKAADDGTAMHAKLETLFQDHPTLKAPFELEVLEGLETFLTSPEHAGLTAGGVLASELKVFSVKLGLAGTMDLLCRDKNGDLVILDWKRSAKSKKYEGQLNLYKYLLEENYTLDGEPILIERLVVVKMHPEIAHGYLSVETVKIWGKDEVEALLGIASLPDLANLSMSSP